MLKLRHAQLAIFVFVALTNAIFGEGFTGVDPQLDSNATASGDHLDKAADDSRPTDFKTEKSAHDNQNSSAEVTAIMQRLIVTVRTNNGFAIRGIPAKPNMLPINVYGTDVKIPWSAVSSVQFSENGGINVALEDGSRMNGYTLLEELELEKEWGSIRVQRHQLQMIQRTQLESTRQSTLRAPDPPHGV